MRNNFFAKQALHALENLNYGAVVLTTPEGIVHHFRGAVPGPEATMVVHDWVVAKNALMKGDIGLGEDYIAGLWDTDSIENLFTVFLMNMTAVEKNFAHGSWLNRLGFVIYDRILRRNSKKGSKNNISAHYDIGNDFYRLWLDDSMTYSSALFRTETDTLAEAQGQKYQRILDRIGKKGADILEIGCGWGGFAEKAAEQGQNVTGVTISKEQYDFATKRLQGKGDIRLQDYRDIRGTFDAVVSIEMFEAVGEKYWADYFKAIGYRLKKGGTAVIQTITIADDLFDEYRKRSDFIRRYVFPGGMLPSKQSFCEAAGKAGLICTNVHNFGKDYARTLREWLGRFDAREAEIAAMGYDREFIRNWRFYLGICAAAFEAARTDVMQIELRHAS